MIDKQELYACLGIIIAGMIAVFGLIQLAFNLITGGPI